ncbi:hypothetical protein BBJ28_00024836 [Nothophytophthora sp. Chile5]|nr:hypothetical protein BBJ28_00024836 [Nothophytophthora sp. Chile5]
MTGPRRLRKRSASASLLLLPTYVALLEPLILDMRATRDHKRPSYVLEVQRRALPPASSSSSSSERSSSSTSWSLSRPFEDYEAFHERLVCALQHGHFCSAGCPWLYTFLSSYFPKKSIFQAASSGRTVEARRAQLLGLLTSTQEFLLARKNHACSIAITDVARQLAEFVYGEDAVAEFIVETYAESDDASSSRRKSPLQSCSDDEDGTEVSSSPADPTICGICSRALACEPVASSYDDAEEPTRYSTSSAIPLDRGNRRSGMMSSGSSMSLSSRRRRRRRVTSSSQANSPAASPTSASCSPSKPSAIAYLDQFSLEMTATKHKHQHGKDVRYALVVTPAAEAEQQWHVSRSYKELAAFQQRLLDAMQLGHFCQAECPYLYSSMKGRFPKECYLYSSSSYVMERRRHAMGECFSTLLEALRKRENHMSCSVLAGAVAHELIAFLNEDLPIDHEYRWENFVSVTKTPGSNSTWYSTDSSSRSLTPTPLAGCCWQAGSDDSLDSFRSAGSNNSLSGVCGLCEDASAGALTTLSCGHRFHDECVIAKLNEALECPTCGQALGPLKR